VTPWRSRAAIDRRGDHRRQGRQPALQARPMPGGGLLVDELEDATRRVDRRVGVFVPSEARSRQPNRKLTMYWFVATSTRSTS
jgi:hypothetical protein